MDKRPHANHRTGRGLSSCANKPAAPAIPRIAVLKNRRITKMLTCAKSPDPRKGRFMSQELVEKSSLTADSSVSEESLSTIWVSGCRMLPVVVTALKPSRGVDTRRSGTLRPEFRNSQQIVGGASEDEQPPDLLQTSQFGPFFQSRRLFQPAKGLLHQPAFAEADPVSLVPRSSSAATALRRFVLFCVKCGVTPMPRTVSTKSRVS